MCVQDILVCSLCRLWLSWVDDYLLIAVCISYFTWKAQPLWVSVSCKVCDPACRQRSAFPIWRRDSGCGRGLLVYLIESHYLDVCSRHSAPGADGIIPALLLVMWACVSPVGGGRKQAGLMGLRRTPVKLLWCCLFLTNPDVCLTTPYLPNFPLSQPKFREGLCVEINSWRMIPSLMPWFGFPALTIWNC